jgi:GST-like protein
MITIHAFATPNSVRVPIALEELGLEYQLVAVNVRKDEQKQPGFLALNPNGKVPLLIAARPAVVRGIARVTALLPAS